MDPLNIISKQANELFREDFVESCRIRDEIGAKLNKNAIDNDMDSTLDCNRGWCIICPMGTVQEGIGKIAHHKARQQPKKE